MQFPWVYLKGIELVIVPILNDLVKCRRLCHPLYHITIARLYYYPNLNFGQIGRMSIFAGRVTQGAKQGTWEKEDDGQLITKEFINNLKLEIAQKVKPSKSILQALKHSNTINQSYKKTIEQLNAKIEQLTLENSQLKERLRAFEEKQRETNNPNNNSLLLSVSQQKLLSEVQISSTHQANDQREYIFEIKILKEKIQQLQENKVMKESKFKEILEKQAIYLGEINNLKDKNKTLQSSIKHLESSLHKLKGKSEEAGCETLARKKSSGSQKFKEYINNQDSFKEDKSIDEARQIQHLILPKENNSLLESFTQDIHITEPFGQQAERSRAIQNNSFIQMDQILGEEVSSNRNSKQHIEDIEATSRCNLNNSIIAISINPYNPNNYQ